MLGGRGDDSGRGNDDARWVRASTKTSRVEVRYVSSGQP